VNESLKKLASVDFARNRRPLLQAAWPARFILVLLLSATALITGCGHKVAQQQVPPPPPIAPTEPAPSSSAPEKEPEKIDIPANAKPIFAETGTASWYGAPYHNRRGSNGEIYNMNAMTAAHLTLPLGSIVRVTNLKTEHTALVRITDRGPFVSGRIIDLSMAAAKALDVYLPGTAKIRLEVLQSPVPLDSGGRWAVQIGAFKNEKAAAKCAEHLQRRYQTAKVLKFRSPVGAWWVRVRVLDDDRQRATALIRETTADDATVFLVRLD
jgi:rare lipoprotein A